MSEEKSKVAEGENFIITEQALSIIIATLEKMPYKEVEHILVPLKHQPGFIGKFSEYKQMIIDNYKQEQELLSKSKK
mgnify:CR=1 FL=1